MTAKHLGALALGLVLLLAGGGGASAHADIERSLPEAGSTVERSPERIEIWFTQEIASGSAIEVVDEAGKPVTAAVAELDLMDPDRKRLTVELRPELPAGVYTVTWTTVSAEDGDTETGSFTFTIAGSATPVASPAASPAASPRTEPTASPKPATSGSLQTTEPEAKPANIDDRALAIAIGAGILAALFIYGFWRLVRPKRHPFDRTGK